jgi:ABC-2 type transport system ATP-binding protein
VSATISVRELRKSYGSLTAVDGITFDVQPGEFYAILGPNGAGKTTTLEILEGLRQADRGEVSVLGLPPWPRNQALLPRIGVQLQASSFFERLTAREQIRTFASLYGVGTRRADDMLAVVGLTEQASVRAEKLSGGQAQRLSIACALVHDPELVFLDEPTTGFDPAARRTAWETIRSLKQLGKTVLLTTHYLDEAQELADSVAIIKGGRILAEGSPSELGVGGGSRYRVAYANGDGEPTVIETDDPTRLLHELTGAALERGEPLRSLSVTRPSLEDVYLELTADA